MRVIWGQQCWRVGPSSTGDVQGGERLVVVVLESTRSRHCTVKAARPASPSITDRPELNATEAYVGVTNRHKKVERTNRTFEVLTGAVAIFAAFQRVGLAANPALPGD